MYLSTCNRVEFILNSKQKIDKRRKALLNDLSIVKNRIFLINYELNTIANGSPELAPLPQHNISGSTS